MYLSSDIWTELDDVQLMSIVKHQGEEHNEINWTHVSNLLDKRHSAKQCRERWEKLIDKTSPDKELSAKYVMQVRSYAYSIILLVGKFSLGTTRQRLVNTECTRSAQELQ